jgi:pyruvate,water dikinase
MVSDLDVLLDDRAEADRVRAERPDLASVTDSELVERARSLAPLIRRLFDRHLEMTAATSVGAGVLGQVAAALGDPTLPLTLITSVGDVDSALPSREMWALSRLDPDSDEFRTGFAELLERHGSRGPNEWDIHSDTWGTRPELVTALIDVMRTAPDGADPAVRDAVNAAARNAATERVRAALADQPETLGMFEAALRSAHLYMAGRERAKTTIISVIHEVRLAVRELGARYDYTLGGITMLLADELDAFVSAPDEYRARLSVRAGQYEELRALDPPFIVNGVVPPLSAWARVDDRPAVAVAVTGEVLTGVAGSPGSATGTARVVLDPADPFALGPGEILVAPITDPAWTPLFVPAAAVVVDVGAPVSHAVIVSRELGIPCVVSVHDATRRIPDGATVTVDGAAGTVTVH